MARVAGMTHQTSATAVTVAVIALALGGCTVDGVYVSRSQQHGGPVNPATASCEQRCAAQFPGPATGYPACLARCPDVAFVEEAVCAPAHQSLCVPDSHSSSRRTKFAVVAAVGGVATLAAGVFIEIVWLLASW